MPKQITQWQCEICGFSVPGWTEADAMECEASHMDIQRIQELHYAYPGDIYPYKVTILFNDGKCQEFTSNLSGRNVAYRGNTESWHHSEEGRINLQE